ncbi:hypothetical protein JVT61DRAFT_2119 [Boletus reticuloceps]|uniref:Cyclin-D1-binding protein 1-like C-terminal domain-containing protein n=1 Tax=Boletus reticuloceps TaxID=495285 RepID=A0A8I3ABA0_9AGAM|nr:hypothetical protein JVT61DRAFT_2119 [Boletus reticuloceps]
MPSIRQSQIHHHHRSLSSSTTTLLLSLIAPASCTTISTALPSPRTSDAASRTSSTPFVPSFKHSSTTAGDEYLVRTATLHDLITNARSPSGIQKDNQAAVYRAWKSDRESLEDNLKELAILIKDAESDNPSDQADDGWDDIGLGHSAKMDEHELARANNIHQLLRLTTLLHKRIFLDLLPHPSSAPVSAFDDLLLQSNQLLSTSDDLVAALYTPHDPAYIREQILELAEIATALQTQLAIFLPNDLTNQLRALNVDNGNAAPTKKMADKKWFDTCVDQILRLCSHPSVTQ